MAQLTFGAILAEAREHQGMDVATAARRLRIRPDILRSIEAEDFSRMPPRGYTRNMINAYARLVGLNPTEITRMYLDAAYAFQVGKARSDSLPSADPSAGRRVRGGASGRTRRPAQQEERPLRQNALGRTVYDDRRTPTRSDYGSAPTLSTGRARQADRMHPSRHPAMASSHYTNFYAGPQGTGAMRSRLPFFIAGGIILVLLVVVLFLVFGPKGGQQEEEVLSVPITGLTDTTQTGEDGEAAEEQPKLTAPTSVTVEYRVGNSSDAYVEIAVDGGAAEPMYLEAGTVETVDVTGTWSLSTWTTDIVQVTVDGERAEFSQSGSGIPTCTVSFDEYLTKWLEEHPGASAGSTSDDSSDSASDGDAASGGASDDSATA